MTTQPLASRFFDIALWIAGLGHFVILIASLQVPIQLDWKHDLAQIRPLNRKLLWVQGAFTVLTIIAFGTLILVLHRELLRGDRAAMGLIAFIAVYWSARVGVDAVYFSHADWPPGRRFIVGHVLLTSLFTALASFFIALLLWNLLRPT